jgi:predicted MFS family arabinose efflux permease
MCQCPLTSNAVSPPPIDAWKYRHGLLRAGAGAAPALASASVALNTSVLYIGQAVGSAIGGVLFAHDLLHGAGYVAAGFIALALMVVILTRPRRAAAWST